MMKFSACSMTFTLLAWYVVVVAVVVDVVVEYLASA
jgi:hypothetical protein